MADEIKPLDGKTTFDDKVMFEAQRLSYDAARVIAEKIARRISERTKGKYVVIVGMQLLADMSNLVATKAVLEELAAEYDALATSAHSYPSIPYAGTVTTRFNPALAAAVIPVWGTVSAGVQGALTLFSLFRQDVDYKGVPLSIDTLAFELELAARLRMHKAKEVVVPDFAVFAKPASTTHALETLIAKVKDARLAAMKAAAPPPPRAASKWSEGDEQTEAHTGYLGKELRYKDHEAIAKADAIAEAIPQIDKRLDDLQTQLLKGDTDGSGLTMLARLLRAETITAGSPTLVHVRVVLAGGNNRVQHSLWSSIFSGDGLSSSGGAVVSWAILNTNGAVEDGGVLSHSMSAKSPKPPETPPSVM